MCGIAGILSNKPMHEEFTEIVSQMNLIQKHRGPDDSGVWYNPFCILGHTRLSIIDLSSDGHQPFFSDDNRYAITFNGEIFNYIELRKELEGFGYNFRTKTDIEVLLKMYIHFGANCLHKLNGMFAFVIFDKGENTTFIARDRVGVKPFYYTIVEEKLYFASEIKSLRNIKGVDLTTDESTLFDYFCFNRTDVYDETFHNGIKRLPKGHFAYSNKENQLDIRQWWNPSNFINSNLTLDESDITKEISLILQSSVDLRLRSDVPIGSCLSGGLDSSILLGILSKNYKLDNYKTFTASFPGESFDETQYVDKLIDKYPIKNYRIYPKNELLFDEYEKFSYFNDEPTGSPSVYSQYCVMRAAHENGVTVLLDGQGGDESFAGYQYFHGFNFTGLFRQSKYIQLGIELSKAAIRKQEKEAFQTFIFQLLPKEIKKLALYKQLKHINKDFFYDNIEKSKIFNEFFNAKDLNESLVLHFKYKLEHLLRTEDRNSMAFAIEARVPYLDYRLIEFMLSVPSSMKIQKGENKILQKKALGHFTIPEILNRLDKNGFETPTGKWLNSNVWSNYNKNAQFSIADKYLNIFTSERSNLNPLNIWKFNQMHVWESFK